ncbi:MAG: hypothetical protein ACE5GC_07360, partial [Acidimicrobiia bacterium]
GAVEVTAADGSSHTIQLTLQEHECSVGRLYFTAAEADGLAAANLGPAPFVYGASLVLDGMTYVGTGTWPDDVDPECAPCVPLVFSPPLPALGAVVAGPEIEALQIDGAWVFRHHPGPAMDALHSGVPEIVDGCLLVDDTIVVWHADSFGEARDAVAAALAGEPEPLLIGGGGFSLEEGATIEWIPDVVSSRCEASAVWFGAP